MLSYTPSETDKSLSTHCYQLFNLAIHKAFNKIHPIDSSNLPNLSNVKNYEMNIFFPKIRIENSEFAFYPPFFEYSKHLIFYIGKIAHPILIHNHKLFLYQNDLCKYCYSLLENSPKLNNFPFYATQPDHPEFKNFTSWYHAYGEKTLKIRGNFKFINYIELDQTAFEYFIIQNAYFTSFQNHKIPETKSTNHIWVLIQNKLIELLSKVLLSRFLKLENYI